MSHTCATQERVAEDWTFPNISEVLEGFPGYGDESHQDDIFKPIFFCNIWSAQIQAWSPPRADKACGQMKASPESPPSLRPDPVLQLMVTAG